jgi:hypothetical protein
VLPWKILSVRYRGPLTVFPEILENVTQLELYLTRSPARSTSFRIALPATGREQGGTRGSTREEAAPRLHREHLDISSTRLTDDEATFLSDFLDEYDETYKGRTETRTTSLNGCFSGSVRPSRRPRPISVDEGMRPETRLSVCESRVVPNGGSRAGLQSRGLTIAARRRTRPSAEVCPRTPSAETSVARRAVRPRHQPHCGRGTVARPRHGGLVQGGGERAGRGLRPGRRCPHPVLQLPDHFRHRLQPPGPGMPVPSFGVRRVQVRFRCAGCDGGW